MQERLRRAELTSLEERARRRLTTVVAASVLAARGPGGGGWMLVKADRDGRVAAMTRDVNDALNKSTVLRAQASSATTGGACRSRRRGSKRSGAWPWSRMDRPTRRSWPR